MSCICAVERVSITARLRGESVYYSYPFHSMHYTRSLDTRHSKTAPWFGAGRGEREQIRIPRKEYLCFHRMIGKSHSPARHVFDTSSSHMDISYLSLVVTTWQHMMVVLRSRIVSRIHHNSQYSHHVFPRFSDVSIWYTSVLLIGWCGWTGRKSKNGTF